MILDVILPAGGKIDAEFAAKVGTDRKPLIEIGGMTVLERTLDALDASGVVGRKVLIGGDEVLAHPAAKKADILVKEGLTGPENIFKGLDALGTPKKVLVVTTDLPFLTANLIKRFVEACPPSIDICLPLVSQQSFNERYPGCKATFITLKDNTWTTGCAYVLDAQSMITARPYIEKVFENRKSKFGMAMLLGPIFVVKWLRKSLDVSDVESKIRSLLKCSGAAIRDSDPELSFDLDYLEDYEYAIDWHAKQVATLL